MSLKDYLGRHSDPPDTLEIGSIYVERIVEGMCSIYAKELRGDIHRAIPFPHNCKTCNIVSTGSVQSSQREAII